MSRRQMWFGNKERMAWVSVPKIGRGSSRVGHQTSLAYQDGGIGVRRSLGGHKVYDMEWGLRPRKEARAISDFYDGVHGEGPFYWIDPMAIDQNLLPQAWAAPALGARGGVSMAHDFKRPSLVPTSASDYGFPAQSASYSGFTTPATVDLRKTVWLPIPPGHTAYLYAWGSGAVRAVAHPTVGGVAVGSPLEAPWNAVNATTPIPLRVDSTGLADGIHVYLNGTGDCIVTALQVVLVETTKVAAEPVNLATNPSFEAAGAIVTINTNLAINPSFEAAGAAVPVRTNQATPDTTFTIYQAGTGTAAASTEQARRAGGTSMKLTAGASAALRAGLSKSAMTASLPAGTYTLSGWVYIGAGGFSANGLIAVVNTPNGVITGQAVNVVGAWARASVTLLAEPSIRCESGSNMMKSD